MSEHLWAEENLTAHAMGGLEGAERERLQAHVAECADCARELEAARIADRGLVELFMSTRPSPALEDQMIQTLRQEPLRIRWFAMPRSFKVALAAAAVVMLAVTGAGLTSWIEGGGLSLPWASEGRSEAKNNLMQAGADYTRADELSLATRQMMRVQGPSGFVSGLTPAGTFTPESNTPVQDADSLARSLRDEAEKSLAMTDVSWGRTLPNFKEPSPGLFLADGADSKGKEGRKAAPPTIPGSPPPPPYQTPPDVAGGEPVSGSGVAESKPDKEVKTKLGVQFGQSDPYSKPSDKPGFDGTVAKPEGESKAKFQRVDNRPNTYFKPADAFTNGVQPKAPAAAEGGARIQGIWIEDGEQAGRRLGESLEEKRAPKAEPAVEPQGVKLAAADPKPMGRKIIRSGDIEFEIDSFDAAVEKLVRFVQILKGAFVSTINSDKLPNGKVKGSVVIRVPPEELDRLVTGLREVGELKSQRIGSQDITKQYTDMESRLKAARTMEERLIKMIAEGKGQLKDIFQVEKELGVWRTKIEELEGELRYYSNLVSLSTLNVILTEKEIRTAASVKESERVNAGIEVEDVDKGLREAIQAILEQKGRITRSELKQHSAGQFNALLHFETAPEVAGLIRDRLKQLGNMVRLEIDRVQQAEGGTVPKDAKIKKGDTQFFVSLYNLANVAPRETVVHRIAAGSVPESYQKLREAIGKAKGRVVTAQLNEKDPTNIHALVEFDIRRTDEAAILLAIKDSGESITRQVSRLPEGENVTDAKILFRVELVNAANIPPRETVKLAVVVKDVEKIVEVLKKTASGVEGRVGFVQTGLEATGRITARGIFDVPLFSSEKVVADFKKTGHVRVEQTAEDPQAPQGKYAIARIDITLSNELLVPESESLWPQIRHGLSVSLRGLTMSVSFVVVGLVFVLPWVLLVYAVVFLVRRMRRTSAASAPR